MVRYFKTKLIRTLAHLSRGKKAAFVSGTYAGRPMISGLVTCLHGQIQTSATSPSAIPTTEKSHSSCEYSSY